MGFYNGILYSAYPTTYNGTYTDQNIDGGITYYYINGERTSLDINGYGNYGGLHYSSYPSLYGGYDGSNYTYYIDGLSTALDANGYGDYNNLHYSSYPTLYGGYDSATGYYYIDGVVATTLNSSGSGCWNNTNYYNGTIGIDPTFSGYSACDSIYYITGQQTTLDSTGSGSWNGDTYLNGVLVPGSRNLYFNGAIDNDWNTLGNWWNDSNYTDPATSLPSSIDNIFVVYESGGTTGIFTNSGSVPTINNLYITSNNNEAYISIEINVLGLATFDGPNTYLYTTTPQSGHAIINGNCLFINGSSPWSTVVEPPEVTINGNVTFNDNSYNYRAYINGNAIFNDNSYNNNGTINGNVTFRGSSYNRSGITGSVTIAYEKGINGSSILGIV